jgi:hypothetical protein
MTTMWALEQNKFDDSDRSWCRGLGVEFQLDPLYCSVYSGNHLIKKRVTGLQIRLTTTCKQQETMLRLKYGNALVQLAHTRPV